MERAFAARASARIKKHVSWSGHELREFALISSTMTRTHGYSLIDANQNIAKQHKPHIHVVNNMQFVDNGCKYSAGQHNECRPTYVF